MGTSQGGLVSLIEDADLQPDNITAYLCGSPDMVEATLARLIAGGVAPERILSEQFRPDGALWLWQTGELKG